MSSERHSETTRFIRVTFVEPEGRCREIKALVGQNLMDAALLAGVAGITGQCGAAINCATCLCNLTEADQARLTRPSADERELLSYVDEATISSRLSCQIIAAPDIDGLRLEVVRTVS